MASRYDHQTALLELERRFKAGDKNALADALLLVVFNRLEPPFWVRVSFLNAHARVARGIVKSWDNVLGKRHAGKHITLVRRRA